MDRKKGPHDIGPLQDVLVGLTVSFAAVAHDGGIFFPNSLGRRRVPSAWPAEWRRRFPPTSTRHDRGAANTSASARAKRYGIRFRKHGVFPVLPEPPAKQGAR